MIKNIMTTYNKIEKDLIENQADLFLRYNYFTHKSMSSFLFEKEIRGII